MGLNRILLEYRCFPDLCSSTICFLNDSLKVHLGFLLVVIGNSLALFFIKYKHLIFSVQLSVTYTQVKEQDIPQIFQIQRLTFEKLYNKYKDESSPFNEAKESLLEKINRPNVYFYFIKKEDKIICYVCTATNDEQTKGKIGPIGIIPEYENQGLGTKAMLLVEKEFLTVKEWSLDTILQESKLTHLYSKIGYKKTGEIMPIQEGMDIIFFIKK
ncbi:GNAT family N-acetyltransferase [Vagococcus carniphilus]|uniref:GNAT family N-acetyltransferase n=1 Tax=Vagococcus carniphilus TaxID=218144 RepID=UPI003B5C3CC0